MIRSLSHIKVLTVLAILIGFALASEHHDNVTLHSGELIVKIGDPECTMCDGTVQIDNEILTVTSPNFNPISTVPDDIVLAANLPFERITKERAPPTRA